MRYCTATVEPPRDTVVTLACQLPMGNVVALWYYLSHDILYWHKWTSGATRKYCNDTRVTVEPPRDTVLKPGYKWSYHWILC